MILRKPYAFLIKHFRAIHLILGALVIFLVYKTTGILSFFNNYASAGRYEYVNNLAGKNVTFFMYLAVFLIIGICIAIFFLMRQKKKPTKLYVATIVYYIFIFIMLTIAYSIFQTIQTETLATETIRVYRDVSFIIYIPQFFFVFYSLFRGFGFDIKKFNFSKDEAGLEIEEEDREEVEIQVPKETYKVERTARRFIREMYYYFRENTFMIVSIIAIVVLVIGTTAYFNRNVYNKSYSNNQTFTYKSFQLKTTEAMLTDISYNGTKVMDGKYYLVINMNVTNRGTTNTLDIKDFRLMVGKDIIYPTYNYNENFLDYGVMYKGEGIKWDEPRDAGLVFELTKEQARSSYKLRVVEKIEYGIGELSPHYKDITIRPTKVSDITKIGTYKLNEEIVFSRSNIKNSTLKVKTYGVMDVYRYKYDYCFNDICTESTASVTPEHAEKQAKTLLYLDYDINIVDSFYKNYTNTEVNFFLRFAKVRYKVANEIYTTSVTNKTPNTLPSGNSVLQVNADIKRATEIDLIITIRDCQYIVKLK